MMDARNCDTATQGVSSGALAVPLAMAPFLASVDVAFGRKEWMTTPPIVVAVTICAALSLAACILAPRHVMAAVSAGARILLGFTLLAVLAIVGEFHAGIVLFREESKDAMLPLAAAFFIGLGLSISAFCRDDSRWRCGALCTLVLLVGSILWDSQYPGTFSFLTTRAAGLGINPNSGAAFTVLALLACLDWRECRLNVRAVALMAFAGGGVFLTLSRSGMLTWFLLCAFYAWRAMKRDGARTSLLLFGIGAVVSLGAASTSDWLRDSVPMLDATTARLEAFLGNGDAMDHADDTRIHLLQDYFQLALERPWLGWGNGILLPGEECYAHNIFLHKWVQHGLLALIVSVLLVKATYSLGVRLCSVECQALAGYLFVQAWFTHHMFDDRPVLLMWAILVGRAGCHAYDVKTTAISSRRRDINTPLSPRRRIDAPAAKASSVSQRLRSRPKSRSQQKSTWNLS